MYTQSFVLYQGNFLVWYRYWNYNFISIANKRVIDYITDDIDTGTNVYTSQLAWAIPKQSPYDGIFTYNINKLKEIGVVERYSLKYSTQDQFCASYSGKPLGIKQCFTAFTALLVGILAGSLWLG